MYNTFPYMIAPSILPSQAASTSIFSKIKLSSILSGAGKTLNFINQAIPVYYQVKPVIQNIRQLGKIGKEIKKTGTTNNIRQPKKANIYNNTNYSKTNNSSYIPVPTFFI